MLACRRRLRMFQCMCHHWVVAAARVVVFTCLLCVLACIVFGLTAHMWEIHTTHRHTLDARARAHIHTPNAAQTFGGAAGQWHCPIARGELLPRVSANRRRRQPPPPPPADDQHYDDGGYTHMHGRKHALAIWTRRSIRTPPSSPRRPPRNPVRTDKR